MQRVRSVWVFSSVLSSVAANKANPIEKTLEFLTTLQSDIQNAGDIEGQAFHKYQAYCSNTAQQKQYEIKVSGSAKIKLEAAIADAASKIDQCSAEIEQLSLEAATAATKLKAATAIRNGDKDNFLAAEKELMQAVAMLNKAISVIESDASKGASMLQTRSNSETLDNVLLGLASVVDAAGFLGEDDKQELIALVQRHGDSSNAPPSDKAYENHSGGIVGVMEELRDKAELQLRKERLAEKEAQHNFELLRMALKDAIRDGEKQKADEKNDRAQAEGQKASGEGKLHVTKSELKQAESDLFGVQQDCMRKASDHEITVSGRKEELSVLEKAKEFIQASIGDAKEDTSSFLQIATRSRSKNSLLGEEVLALISKVALEQKDESVVKLASKVKAALRFASADDPFTKVKQLIKDLIRKLEREARQESSEKAYCDREMGQTIEKKSDLEDQAAGLKVNVDQAATQSAQLKEEVSLLAEELAALVKSQQDMNNARSESKRAFEETVATLQKGLGAIRGAIRVLKDYYASEHDDPSLVQTGTPGLDDSDDDDATFIQQPAAPETHKSSAGAGASIIGLLEIIETDMAKNLAQEDTEEANAVDIHQQETQTNRVTKALKREDTVLKTKQIKSLDKAVGEYSGDLATTSEELEAVNEFFTNLKARCVAQPEKYEDVKRRREKEIKGLQEAVAILTSEQSFLQRRKY